MFRYCLLIGPYFTFFTNFSDDFLGNVRFTRSHFVRNAKRSRCILVLRWFHEKSPIQLWLWSRRNEKSASAIDRACQDLRSWVLLLLGRQGLRQLVLLLPMAPNLVQTRISVLWCDANLGSLVDWPTLSKFPFGCMLGSYGFGKTHHRWEQLWFHGNPQAHQRHGQF